LATIPPFALTVTICGGRPLSMRQDNLAQLLARRPDGIFVAEFEQSEIGPDLFRKACEFGLDGLVSKHRDRAYRGGRCNHRIKDQDPKGPAMKRAAEVDWSWQRRCGITATTLPVLTLWTLKRLKKLKLAKPLSSTTNPLPKWRLRPPLLAICRERLIERRA
jgi:hypothetical protein